MTSKVKKAARAAAHREAADRSENVSAVLVQAQQVTEKLDPTGVDAVANTAIQRITAQLTEAQRRYDAADAAVVDAANKYRYAKEKHAAASADVAVKMGDIDNTMAKVRDSDRPLAVIKIAIAKLEAKKAELRGQLALSQRMVADQLRVLSNAQSDRNNAHYILERTLDAAHRVVGANQVVVDKRRDMREFVVDTSKTWAPAKAVRSPKAALAEKVNMVTSVLRRADGSARWVEECNREVAELYHDQHNEADELLAELGVQ